MTKYLFFAVILTQTISCNEKPCISNYVQKVEAIEDEMGNKMTQKYFVNQTICPNQDTTFAIDGKIELFDDNKTLIYDAIYVNNELNGLAHEYHPNGNIKMIYENKDNHLVSIKSIYTKESIRLDTNILINGTGFFKKYYSNSNLEIEYELLNGKQNGKEIYYDTTGLKRVEFNWEDGKKNGNYYSYYSNSNIEVSCLYENDILVGEYLEYYESGNLKRKTDYKFPPYNARDSLRLRLTPIDPDDILNMLDSFDPGGFYNGIKVGKSIEYKDN